MWWWHRKWCRQEKNKKRRKNKIKNWNRMLWKYEIVSLRKNEKEREVKLKIEIECCRMIKKIEWRNEI